MIAPGLERDRSIRDEVNRCVFLCKEGISLERLLEQPARQRIYFATTEKPTTAFEGIRQGEHAAKEERRRLGLGGVPIGNIAELLSSQGIWCASTQLPPEMSGLFLYHSTFGTVILINSTHSESRQRFSYAHEYAHALFDAQSQVLISEKENSSELLEKRANSFAAAFLMPKEGIDETMYFLNKGRASRTFSSIFDVSTQGVIETEDRQIVKNQKLSPQDAAYIAYRFGVSYQAAVYRLHSLNYLSPQEREDLLDQEGKGKDYLRLLGLEEKEPTKRIPLMQQELRTYISRLVIEAFRQEKISRGRIFELSKLLKLPPEDLIELANTENE